MKITSLFFLILIGLLFACKKDRLKDDISFLVGTWQWKHTLRIYQICEGDYLEEILLPNSEGVIIQ